MTVSYTQRFNLPKWSAGTDPWPQRAGWNTILDKLETLAAQGLVGTLAERPAAGVPNRFYWETGASPKLWFDDGTMWSEVSPLGGSAPLPNAVSGSEGSSNRSARADHEHAIKGQWIQVYGSSGVSLPSNGDWKIVPCPNVQGFSGTMYGQDAVSPIASQPGLYRVSGFVQFSGSATGRRMVGIGTGGIGVAPSAENVSEGAAGTSGLLYRRVNTDVIVGAGGGRISLWAAQESGSTISAINRRLTVEYRG